jgi:hypothetical protein
VYNGAGVQGTVAVLELAGTQGRRQPPQFNIFFTFSIYTVKNKKGQLSKRHFSLSMTKFFVNIRENISFYL